MKLDVSVLDDISAEQAVEYVALRRLPDGRIIGAKRLLFHWSLNVGIDAWGYQTRYCYWTQAGVLKAFDEWDGVGDPRGWHRHPDSGRRRNNATGVEWCDGDPWRPEHNSDGDQPGRPLTAKRARQGT